MKRRLLRLGLGLVLLAGGLELAILATPLPGALKESVPPSAEIVDRSGRPLRSILVEERHYSHPVAFTDLSPSILHATVSAEDKRFYRHPGVDPWATLRAVSQVLRGEGATSGASTISQQLIKLAEPGPRTLGRKVREIWLALKLEQTWSKERILSGYLDRLDYGNLCTGLAAASRFYFAKPPADLSPAEAALLAGLPNAPGRLNPHANPAAALRRQRWVLARMRADGALDEAAFRRARAEPLHLQPPGRRFEAPHFVDLLLRRQGILSSGNGRVQTSLDLELNRWVEDCLKRNLERVAEKDAGGGAVVVIENATGEVWALAGSGDYFEASAGQVNGAWIVRSPGSAVKPFTYLLALENGAEPCTVVPDVATAFPTETGLYRPNNYNHRFHGPVSLRFALGNSLNVAAIKSLELGGGPEALHRLLRECGISTLGHPASHYGLGLTLGNGEVRLLELTNAFAMLARLGTYRPFRLLREGAPVRSRRVANEAASWQIADMLSDDAARLASFGPRSYLHFDFPVACKTGTSSDYRDNWTMAYTPEFTVGVWVGNPDGHPMRGITGVTGAAPVMHEVMCHLHETFGTSWYQRPEGLRKYPVEPLTGRLVSAGRSGAVEEWCREAPEATRVSDFDASGKVRLGLEYAEWWKSGQDGLGDLAVLADRSESLRILEPEPGSVYFIDQDMPAESQWIPLRVEGGVGVRWSSDPGLRLEDGRMWLREGRHVLTACDAAGGDSVSTWVEVRRW